MDVSWPITGTVAGAVCAGLALVAFFYVRWAKKNDTKFAKYLEMLDEEIELAKKYADVKRTGTPFELMEAKKALDEKRQSLDELVASMHSFFSAFAAVFSIPAMAFVLTLTLATGCASTKVKERIIQLNDHVKIVQPGETVPEYPNGETRWWLMTPTGMDSVIPQYRQKEF